MISGIPPFQSKSEYMIFKKIEKLEYSFHEGFDENAKDLVKKLLVIEPKERLGMFFIDISIGYLIKVNSVQEACAKCFLVLILNFEILQITWKRWNKEHRTLSFQFFSNRSSILMFFVVFYVVCKVSYFNVWSVKHLAQASCTELTLDWNQIEKLSDIKPPLKK